MRAREENTRQEIFQGEPCSTRKMRLETITLKDQNRAQDLAWPNQDWVEKHIHQGETFQLNDPNSIIHNIGFTDLRITLVNQD